MQYNHPKTGKNRKIWAFYKADDNIERIFIFNWDNIIASGTNEY